MRKAIILSAIFMLNLLICGASMNFIGGAYAEESIREEYDRMNHERLSEKQKRHAHKILENFRHYLKHHPMKCDHLDCFAKCMRSFQEENCCHGYACVAGHCIGGTCVGYDSRSAAVAALICGGRCLIHRRHHHHFWESN